MVSVDFNVGELIGATKKNLKVGMIDAVKILGDELKRLTPEDTKEMLDSYVSEISEDSDSLVGEVGNTADHAVYVEYGVEGKNYNYHKPKGSVFYNGVGNRTFARSIDNKKKDILNAIRKSIGGQ